MKTKIFSALIALSLMVILAGCQEKDMGTPAASTVSNFEFSVTNDGYAPCEVTFTNLSLNATGYSWDFNNGQTSTEVNPKVTFETPGFYAVKLTCTSPNSLHYNQLVKTVVVNIKDPNAGLSQVLYYTSRGDPGNGHYVVLDDGAPSSLNFTPMDLTRPYGMAVDTANRKVYIADYSNQVIYQYDHEGKNGKKILDASVAGQELVGDAQGIFVLGDKLYWGRTGGIYRSNLDGTNPEVFINTGGNPPEYPLDMQYDPATNKIYLVNDKADNSGGFWSVNFDGTGLTQIIPDVDGTALEMDFRNGKAYLVLYAAEGTVAPENGVFMCNLDGSSLTKIGDYGSKATWGIALDEKRNKLFWGYKISNSALDGKIIRANLDGSAPEDWIKDVSPHAMTIVWIKL